VKLVSEALGHASITMTLNIYGHVLPHMHSAVASTMDALLLEEGKQPKIVPALPLMETQLYELSPKT
jgi:hypothetical protein